MSLSRARLVQRAAELAKRTSEALPVAPSVGVLRVLLEEQLLGFELSRLSRVLAAPPLFPVPGAKSTLLGVLNDDGQIRPVFSLRSLLGLAPALSWPYIILLACAQGTIGIAIDGLEGSQDVDLFSLSPLPATMTALQGFSRGISLEGLILLDHDAIERALFR